MQWFLFISVIFFAVTSAFTVSFDPLSFAEPYLFLNETVQDVSYHYLTPEYCIISIRGEESLLVFVPNGTILTNATEIYSLLSQQVLPIYEEYVEDAQIGLTAFNLSRNTEYRCRLLIGTDKNPCFDAEAGGSCYRACAPLRICYDALTAFSYPFLEEIYSFTMKSESLSLHIQDLFNQLSASKASSYQSAPNVSLIDRILTTARGLSNSRLVRTVGEGGFEYCPPLSFDYGALNQTREALFYLSANEGFLNASNRSVALADRAHLRVSLKEKITAEKEATIQKIRDKKRNITLPPSNPLIYDAILEADAEKFLSLSQHMENESNLAVLEQTLSELETIRTRYTTRNQQLTALLNEVISLNNLVSSALLESKKPELLFKKSSTVDSLFSFPLTEASMIEIRQRLHPLLYDPLLVQEETDYSFIVSFAVAGLIVGFFVFLYRTFSQHLHFPSFFSEKRRETKETPSPPSEHSPASSPSSPSPPSPSPPPSESSSSSLAPSSSSPPLESPSPPPQNPEIKQKLSSLIPSEGPISLPLTLTIAGKDGKPPPDGTPVLFSATEGSIPASVPLRNGVVQTTITFSERPTKDVIIIMTCGNLKRKIRLPFG